MEQAAHALSEEVSVQVTDTRNGRQCMVKPHDDAYAVHDAGGVYPVGSDPKQAIAGAEDYLLYLF